MKVFTYQEVMDHLKNEKRQKHLLLGNGFSMAYNPSIFSYNALSKFVENNNNDLLKTLFSTIKTRNFEQIMTQLKITKDILVAFKSDSKIIDMIELASRSLRESLIEAIESLHPEHVFKITDEESKTCAEFVKTFLDENGNIFSTNYDVLLYWVLMRNALPNSIDGFGRDVIETGEHVLPEYVELSELRWGNHKDLQNVHYLHGALPFFDDGIEIIKEQYDGDYIMMNIKKRMDSGHYPVFVTAGSSEEKLSHILHNHYLAFCYDKLSTIGGSLITFGFNFGEYDEHIIKGINEASMQDKSKKLWSVYLGAYSDDSVKHFEAIKDKFKCKVNIFDAKTVKVWR